MMFFKNFLVYFLYFLRHNFLQGIYNSHDYIRKYSLLPRLLGFYQKPSLRYQMELWYEYVKYFYESHNKNHQYLLNCISRVFCKYYLSHKTLHFQYGHNAINKIESYKIFKRFGIPFPPTIGITNNNEVIDFEGNKVDIESVDQNLMLFCKKIAGSAGKDAMIIKPKDIPKLNDGYVIQENMSNGDFINMITNGKSNMLNSIRIHTYRSHKTGDVDFMASYLKLGAKNRINDNYGLCVTIDNVTGKLSKYGVEYPFSENRFKEKTKYNITSYDIETPPFDGLVIPNWDEILKIISEATKHIGTLFVGWDVALTDRGIVILEANSIGDIFIPQAFDKEFYNSTLISENLAVANEHKWIKKWHDKYYQYYK